MNDKCESDFQALLKEIAAQAADLSNEPKRANLQVLLAKKKTYQQEDYNFQVSLQQSLKGIALIVAFPLTTEFVLQENPKLPGSQAYQRLLKEYGKIPINVLDKYDAERQVISLCTSPNLGSPQLDIFLLSQWFSCNF